MYWKCPKKGKEGGKYNISKAQRGNVEEKGVEDGRSMMLMKVLLKPKAEVENPL
jgi:hypothetical protein